MQGVQGKEFPSNWKGKEEEEIQKGPAHVQSGTSASVRRQV